MDNKLTFSISNAKNFIRDHEMSYIKEGIECAKEKLLSRQGEGNDFLGWIDLPVAYDKEEFERIKNPDLVSQKITDPDFIVVSS
jgi:glucose-6-phosphate isomerase